MSIPPSHRDVRSAELRWTPDAVLRVAWQRKWLVILGLMIGVGVSAAVFTRLPRVYQSAAQVSIVKKRPDAATGIDTRPLSTDENVSPAHEVLKSTLIIERAIHARGLADLPINSRADADLTDTIRQGLSVVPTRNPTGQTFLYKLSFRAHDADDSRTVLAAVIDSFKEFMDKKHQAVSEDTLELILKEKQALEKVMAEKEAAYRAFREKSPLLGKGRDGLELRQERLNSIQAKRSAFLLQRIELESHLAALEQARKENRSQEAILTMLAEFARKTEAAEPGRERQVTPQEQLFPLLLEERKLLATHGARHPEVLEIRSRIEVARRLLILPPVAWRSEADRTNAAGKEDPVALYTQLLKQKLDHARISEDLLAEAFRVEQADARRLAAFEIENDSLRTATELNQRLYEALVKRLNEVSMIRNVGGYDIELLEPPTLGKRVAPSMTLTLLAGAFGGLFLGLALAGWADLRDTRFRSTADVSRNLGLNILAAIPKGQGSESDAVWKLRNTLSQMAEKNGLKVIQLAEPTGNEGAGAVSANLAAALAQAGKKVLRVDARGNVWNLDALDRNDAAVAVLSIALTDPDAGPRLHDVLAKSRAQYDFVLVESPAVLRSAQASTLAAGVDAVVLTIDLAKTQQPHAERAAQLLASTGVKILGVVVNGVAA